jgi:hypothetical protein
MKCKSIGPIQGLALAFSLVAFLFSATSLCAQEVRGKITGRVTDANKASLPGASVKITDVARGTTVTLTTNDNGIFEAPYLLSGTYQIVVEVTGFKKSIRDGVVLQINETREVEIALEVGGTQETVTVTADAPVLEVSTASMGQVVDQRRVADLPLVHGDPYTLIGLAPGVSFARDQRLDRPFEPTHIVGFTMDGTRANRSDLLIDGAPSTATANAFEVIASYVPPTDIIQEFKIQTATFDSQFGNTEGGVTTISIKSGTNTFHGTAYLWKEPGSLAANDFFGNSRGQPRPTTYSNRPGFSVTGPVTIPKLYHGRDKTFFTFGFEAIRDSRPRYDSTTPSVPTDAMRNGDFSAFLALPNGSQYQIYNPFTRRADPARAGHFIEDAFPGNIIPPNLISPISKGLLQYFGHPKTAGTAEFLNNNVDSTLAEKTKKYNNYTFRIDHALSDKHRIFVRGSWYIRDSFYNDYFNSIATGTTFQFYSRQGVIDDVYTLNPTTVLNVRYGYNRYIRVQDLPQAGWGFDLTSVGFPAAYNDAIGDSYRRFPRIDFPSTPSATYQGTGQSGEFRPVDTHSVAATLNKSVGAHSLKFGAEFRAYRENDLLTSNNQTGQFVFDNTYTRQKDDTSTTQVALSFAAFLLGVPTSSSGVVRAADYAEQSTSWGFFLQDDWKFNSKLTLNLGLRYEFETPLTERYNKSVSGFDFSYVQPFQAAVQTKYATLNDPALKALVPQLKVQGGLLFPSSDNRGFYHTPKHDFMPRVGFAYKLNDKTVVRGGYGIFFGFLGQRRGDVIQTGYSVTTNFVPTTDNVTIKTWSNPFPNGILNPTGSTAGLQTNLGNPIGFFNQHPLAPYMQRWELGFQRELPGGFVIEASYVGNRGTHIEIARDINAVPNRFLSTLPTRDAATNSFLTGSVANPFAGLGIPGIGASSSISRQNLMRPFPEFGSITTTTNDGYSWYHAGQLSLQKRLAKGYTVQLAYTHSKYMQATELLNPGDSRPTEVISDQDYPNRLALSAIYELPFGKGRQFFGNSNGLVQRIIGGWQMEGVYAYQSGAPLSFNVPGAINNNNAAIPANVAATAGYIYLGDFKSLVIPTSQQSVAQWFNNTGFVALRDNKGVVQTVGGQTVWVAFNDPCKSSYNATTCPGTPLANPTGFNRDSAFQLAGNIRTFPLRFSFLRVQPTNNVDFSILKNTRINERMNIQLRAEFTNFFNHPWLSAASGASGANGVVTSPTAANFGQIATSNQGNYPRRVQLGLKFIF